jgi:hypothetical protein
MFVLIVILVVSVGFSLAMAGQRRRSNDPMHEHEQAFATFRRIVESPRIQLNELAERIPVASGHVRILSERPAGLPRSRRKRPPQRARTVTPRRRRLTTAHPKIAISPQSPSVPSAPDTTKANTSLGRDIEVLDHPANRFDRGRGSANVDSTVTSEGPTSDNPVRMTLVRDEAERRNDTVANRDPTCPSDDERRADRSRLKRRPGGNQDALTAAIERAISHIDGTTGYAQLTDAPIPALFGAPRQSA